MDGHVARTGNRRTTFKGFVRIIKKAEHLEDLGAGGKILLKLKM
jgi:hypothetical protein